jgi:NAD-dependent dihydropyrimidine dehydrogenase PreA subunit
MYVDAELCTKCLQCRPVCPVGAIHLNASKIVEIDYEMCVECGVCLRSEICAEGAIQQVPELPYPRVLRAVFSDPTQSHKSTGVAGRGTEEMKTNDVTDIFRAGEIGFSIEVGRPGVGAYLADLDKVTRKITSMGVTLAEDNPVISLIADRLTGALKPEVLGEKVMSAIAEFIVPEDGVFEFIEEIKRFLNAEIDSVATMSLIARADRAGRCVFLERLKEHGENPYPNGKVNIGMALAARKAAS